LLPTAAIRGFRPPEKARRALVVPLLTRSVAQAMLGVAALPAVFALAPQEELDRNLPLAFAETPTKMAQPTPARGHDIAAFE
jgi:hypothetical protein